MIRATSLLLCSCVAAASAHAATFRVDDSATLPNESSAQLRWRQAAPSRPLDSTMEGVVSVQVRLNLAAWQHKNGRLFLVLPEQPGAPVRVSWSTQGRLLPGQLLPGQRTLVYSGPITTTLLDETLVLKIEADGTRLGENQRLKFHFEIDID